MHAVVTHRPCGAGVQSDSAFEDSGKSESDTEHSPSSKGSPLLKIPPVVPSVRTLPRIRRGRLSNCFMTHRTNHACVM